MSSNFYIDVLPALLQLTNDTHNFHDTNFNEVLEKDGMIQNSFLAQSFPLCFEAIVYQPKGTLSLNIFMNSFI